MADQPFFTALSEQIITALESALEGRNPNLPRLTPSNEIATRAGLTQLRTNAKTADSASTPTGWTSAIGEWHTTLTALGGNAFGPGADASAVVARVFQERSPRTANALAAVGVISSPGPGRMVVNLPRLQDVVKDPGSALGDPHWNKVITQAAVSTPGAGAAEADAPTTDRVGNVAGEAAGLVSDVEGVARRVSGGGETYPKVVQQFQQVMTTMLNRVSEGQPVPITAMIALLDPTDGRPAPTEAQLSRSLSLLLELPGEEIFDGEELPFPDPDEPPKRPCTPFPDKLPGEVDKTVDPTGEPFIIQHVLDGIEGLDAQKLTPPELCPDLDIPVWQLLRDYAPDWLLPGVQQLADSSVVSVQTNPVFVEALLLGLNAQTLCELRFRNLPLISGCTPLRQFWSLADHTTGTFVDDIEGVHRWPSNSPLGSPAHRPATSVGSDLVLVFRTSLFRLYPRTLVYLVPAPIENGKPNWNQNPLMNNRVMPSFQGNINPEISYFAFNLTPQLGLTHWVVLEEPSHGLAFFNKAPTPERQALMDAAVDGATFADVAYADPVRVMLRGDALIPGGV